MANPQTSSFVAQAAHPEPASTDEELSMLFSTTYQVHTRWPIDFSDTQWNDVAYQSCQPSCSYGSDEMLHYAAYPGPSYSSSHPSNYQASYSSATNTDPSRPRSDPQLDHLLRSMEKMSEYHPASVCHLEPPELQALAPAAVQPHSAPVRSIEVGPGGRHVTRHEDEVNSRSRCALTRQLARASTEASLVAADGIGAMPRWGGSRGSEAATVSVAEAKDEPYAQLIFRCLKNASNHEMVLKDIYDWFELNTNKARNAKTTGWQNSIRHNLSMNGAFYKVEGPRGGDIGKKGCLWRLSEQALREGVKSTTRYRTKLPNKKRGCRPRNLAPQRQASGGKGGQATRKAAQLRRSERQRETRSPMFLNRLDESDTKQRLAFSSSTPLTSRNPGLEFSTSDDAKAAYPNHSVSPYYLRSDPSFMQTAPRTSRTTLMTPLSAYQESLPNSPDLYNTGEMIHLFKLGCDQPLFYDSPESGDEPLTPPSFDGMPMNLTSLFDPDPFL